MCGLIATNLTVSLNNLIKSLDTLNKRGPDERNYILYNDIFLGHTRLSITGDNGTQPFYIPNKLICIVNGEFYDYKNIKKNLISEGYVFKTDSDSEILVNLYLKYGMRCLDYLNGEFSFILYDIEKSIIYATRDRFGTKPLYFYEKDNKFIFASSLDTIKELVGKFELDEFILKFVQCLQYQPQSKTLFKNINQVMPAQYIRYCINNEVYTEHMYWSRKNPTNIDTDLEHIKFLVTDSIKKRIPDIPFACHLSGGIDSSIISIIANQCKNTTAFSVNFTDDNFYSEYEYAKKTALSNDINLIEVPVSLLDIFNNLENAIYDSNGISINGHIVAKYLLNKEINKHGLKVSLSGEGADEIFYGYSHFNNATSFNKKYLTGIQLPNENHLDTSYIKKIVGSVPTWINAKASIGFELYNMSNLTFTDDVYYYFINEYLSSTEVTSKEELLIATDSWSKYALNGYLLNTLDDSMSMNFSIEGRIPYLDKDLVEYISLLPIKSNFDELGGKSLLRKSFNNIIPTHIINKPKQSFMSPSITYLLKDKIYKKYFTDLIFNSKIAQYYNKEKIIEFINKDLTYSNEPPLMIIISLAILSNKFL